MCSPVLPVPYHTHRRLHHERWHQQYICTVATQRSFCRNLLLQNKHESKSFFRTRRNVYKRQRATRQRTVLFDVLSIRTRATVITQPTQQYVWLSKPQAVAHHHKHPVSQRSLIHTTAVTRLLLNQYQTEGRFIANAFHVCSSTLPYKRRHQNAFGRNHMFRHLVCDANDSLLPNM